MLEWNRLAIAIIVQAVLEALAGDLEAARWLTDQPNHLRDLCLDASPICQSDIDQLLREAQPCA
ncbi:MAG: hypothetical protein ABIK96_00450 [bacterium]